MVGQRALLGHLEQCERAAGEHLRADRRVGLHLRVLRDGELATLGEHRVGDSDLADVVQRRREPEQLDLVGGQSQALRDAARQHADAVCVLAGGVVVQLGGRGEAGEHLELRLFELPRGAAGVGDVLDLGEELRDALRVVADRGERDARLDDAPAAVEVAPLKVLRPRGAAQQRGDGVPAGVTVLGMGELEEGARR